MYNLVIENYIISVYEELSKDGKEVIRIVSFKEKWNKELPEEFAKKYLAIANSRARKFFIINFSSLLAICEEKLLLIKNFYDLQKNHQKAQFKIVVSDDGYIDEATKKAISEIFPGEIVSSIDEAIGCLVPCEC